LGTTSPTGTHSYKNQTIVTITAIPTSYYTFSSWSVKNPLGHTDKYTTKTIKITMDGAFTVTPVLTMKTFTLTSMLDEGGGKYSLKDGNHKYNIGSSVVVTATNVKGLHL
jgi:hypothetical protein